MRTFDTDYSSTRRMKIDLQFFANPENEGGDDAGTKGGDSSGTKPLSFDDFLKQEGNQAEFDRRVAKALETNKTKLQLEFNKQMETAKTEAEKMAKMNAEQKAQYEREKQESELSKREADITRRELTATAKEQLAEKGLPTALSSILNYTDAENCTKSIEAVEKSFRESVEKAVEERLQGGHPPKKKEGGKDKNLEDEVYRMMMGKY